MTDTALDVPLKYLRSFLAVIDHRSFTAAASQLGSQQSTVSQHVQRLEKTLGRTLLSRDTHSVKLTSDGEAFIAVAQSIVNANDRMFQLFATKTTWRKLHFGISEDFASSGLAEVLTSFKRYAPATDIELTVGLSNFLYDRYDAGELDVIFTKRRPGDRRGRLVWQENLVWIGKPRLFLNESEPIPLVAYAPPSITRSVAIEALEGDNRLWRMSCTSGSLSGIRAALLAGLGIAAHSGRLIPQGLEIVSIDQDLPALPRVDFVVIGNERSNIAAMHLMKLLTDGPERFER